MLPSTLKPMLAQKAETPFDSDQHLFEITWHGIRCLAFVESGRMRFAELAAYVNTESIPGVGWFGPAPFRHCFGRRIGGFPERQTLLAGDPIARAAPKLRAYSAFEPNDTGQAHGV